VAGSTWFTDTWGAPRSGGRTHKGVDMSAAFGAKLVAMNSGTVRLNWHSSGGRQVYITSGDGNFYYYAHMSGYAPGLATGQRVNKGQVIGYVGTTGNAATAHLHLGLGLIGGGLVNPYPTVRRVC
jgi:murein DD-endopeptidase MepM/ murein hydrolase activator NlpD